MHVCLFMCVCTCVYAYVCVSVYVFVKSMHVWRSEDYVFGCWSSPSILSETGSLVVLCWTHQARWPVSFKDTLLSTFHFMVVEVLKLEPHMSVCVGLWVLRILIQVLTLVWQ